jgi:putative PEP-CTERM system TPR-repeat lipoprotein
MNQPNSTNFFVATTALLVLLALAACGKGDPSALIASAKSYLAKGDYPASIIQLKTALQEAPDNPEARFLLGKALLDSGNPSGAEVELRKALDFHYQSDDVYAALARALLAQAEYRKLVLELGERKLDGAVARADLSTSLAMAYLALGETSSARGAVDAALAAKPGGARLLTVQAQLDLLGNDLPQALKHLDEAIAAAPNDPDATVFKSQLLLNQGRREEAIKTLEDAIAANPAALSIRFALVPQLVTSKQVEKATAQLEAMKKLAPQDFRTVYSDALVSFARNDPIHARDAVQRILAQQPDNVRALYLSGLVNYQLGSYAAAEEALRRVVALAPSELNAVRVLGLTYLKTGQRAQAVEILEEGLKRAPDDPTLLRTAGEAYLASGNLIKAAQGYERANAIDKGNVASNVRLAQMRFAAGDTSRAFKELESLSQAEPSQYEADIALITANLRQGAFDKALAAVKTLETKQPNNPLTYNLKGAVYLGLHDHKNARTSFEKALELDPNNFNAAHTLALIDLQERKPEDARKRYESIVAREPKNEDMLLALAELAVITGQGPGDVRAAIERAISANPTSVRSRLALINYYARIGDAKAQLAAADAARAALPNDPQIVESFGVAQLAAGERARAIDTFKQLVQLKPQNAMALMRLADAQAGTKDYSAAIESLRKAVAAQPDQAQAWVMMARVFVLSGHPEDAIAEGRKLQKEHPDRALGFAIEAEALAAQKKWSEAARIYREAIARQPAPILAVAGYNALQNAGKASEASEWAAKWTSAHPKDTTMLVFLAEQSLRKKEYRAAAANYKLALEIEPDNTVLLNDLAWALAELGDPKATEVAEKAYRQAPYDPNVIDTLGWTLVRTGDTKRGIELIHAASNLAPANSEIRLHLATAMIKTGDKVGARRELDTLLSKLEKSSPLRADAEKLLSEI